MNISFKSDYRLETEFEDSCYTYFCSNFMDFCNETGMEFNQWCEHSFEAHAAHSAALQLEAARKGLHTIPLTAYR